MSLVAVQVLGGIGIAGAADRGFTPRLCGILVSGQVGTAIFETAPGASVAVGEGEVVGPYRIRAITGEAVRVDQDGRDLVLTISGAGRPAETPADTGGVTFGLVVNPQGPPDD